MRSRLFQILTAFSLICVISGPWTVLQCLAWTRMAVNFSKDASVGEALAKTFDGKHPCRLCKLVEEGKQSSKAAESVSTDRKLDPWVRFEASPFLLAEPASLPSLYVARPCGRSDIPPLPPPKVS